MRDRRTARIRLDEDDIEELAKELFADGVAADWTSARAMAGDERNWPLEHPEE